MPTLERVTLVQNAADEKVAMSVAPSESSAVGVAKAVTQEIASKPRAATPPSTNKKTKKPVSKKPKTIPNQPNIASFFAPRKAPPKSATSTKQSASTTKATSKPRGVTTAAAAGAQATDTGTCTTHPKNSTDTTKRTGTKQSKTSSKASSTSSTKRCSSQVHDKEQIMEIVLGSAVDDTDLLDKPEKEVKFNLPHDSSPLPIPGVRNIGLLREQKRAKKLLVTPSPKPKTKPDASCDEESVNVKLLEKLEKSVDSNKDTTKESVHAPSPSSPATEQAEVSNDPSSKDGAVVQENNESQLVTKNNATAEEQSSSLMTEMGSTEDAAITTPFNEADNKSVPLSDDGSHASSKAQAKTKESTDAHESKVGVVQTLDAANESEPKASTETCQLAATERVSSTDNEGECGDNAIKVGESDVEVVEKLGVEDEFCDKVVDSQKDEPEVEIVVAESKKPTLSEVDSSASHEASKPPVADVPEEIMDLLKKHHGIRSRYRSRDIELIQKGSEGLPEEKFDLPKPTEIQAKGTMGTMSLTKEQEFPDCAVASLAVIVQESRLPLSSLSERAIELLQEAFNGAKFSVEAVTSKIKVLAARESYIGCAAGHSAQGAPNTNVFEDANAERMWRWELVSLELLPAECVSKVKKARMSRRKLRSHHKAITKLLASLDEADGLLLNKSTTKGQRDAILARVSSAEEKVLKYEREAEKNRLAEEAKKKKEEAKAQKDRAKQEEKLRKQQEKERADEEKRKEKAMRQAEKEKKKQEAAQARIELKRKREAEREEGRKKERLEKEEKAKKMEEKMKKQQSMMKSFFSSVRKSKPKDPDSAPETEENPAQTEGGFDVDKFRAMIDSSEVHKRETPLFKKLSNSAVASRTRRTRRVPVTVFVTVMPENPFSEQPYDEEKVIQVPNRYKYLSFHEDFRPPYHGTWSKPRSSVVTGRTPLGKDTAFLDYDVESEAEWEEGDDEPGEDCEDDSADDEEENLEDEEGDTRVYNFQDGWLTHDDDLGRDGEEIDEETLKLRRKKLQESAGTSGEKQGNDPSAGFSTVCVIAPTMGGLPLTRDQIVDDSTPNERIEGVAPMKALDFLALHEGTVCTPDLEFCWDAFPPDLVDDNASPNADPLSTANGTSASAGGNRGKSSSVSQEMSQENLKTFVEFVHNCTLPSKDKVVEQLRTLHKDITSSRAQATRKLDSIAVKKRRPEGGVVWKVKREVLEELGLENLKLQDPPPETDKKESVKDASPGEATGTTKPETPAEGNSSSIDVKKRKRPDPGLSAAAKLFAAYMKKPKVPRSK